MITDVKAISACRSCGTHHLRTVFDIGQLKINAFMKAPWQDVGTAPLTLLRCDSCDLIQLSHTVRKDDLYRNYWYLSRLNKKIVDNLTSIVADAIAEVGLQPGDTVVDIGANDGTLLSFYPKDVCRVGVDPAQNIYGELVQHCEVAIGDFFNRENYLQHVGNTKAKIVTTVAMFCDLDDPNSFVADVAEILAIDGLWLCQLMTVRPMIDSNDLGNIIHENLAYYTYRSLVNLIERHGLEIYKVRENDINGGSYQLFMRHATTGSIEYPEDINDQMLLDWAANINRNRDDTVKFLQQVIADRKHVYIMGASTKGNTIMQYYGLDSKLISGAAEIHPDKIGKYLVGSDISIVHEDEAKDKADYLLVFPFHFRQLFVDSILRDWIAAGGKLIFCTPNFEVVHAQ